MVLKMSKRRKKVQCRLVGEEWGRMGMKVEGDGDYNSEEDSEMPPVVVVAGPGEGGGWRRERAEGA